MFVECSLARSCSKWCLADWLNWTKVSIYIYGMANPLLSIENVLPDMI